MALNRIRTPAIPPVKSQTSILDCKLEKSMQYGCADLPGHVFVVMLITPVQLGVHDELEISK